jgi:hypothetical protein
VTATAAAAAVACSTVKGATADAAHTAVLTVKQSAAAAAVVVLVPVAVVKRSASFALRHIVLYNIAVIMCAGTSAVCFPLGT